MKEGYYIAPVTLLLFAIISTPLTESLALEYQKTDGWSETRTVCATRTGSFHVKTSQNDEECENDLAKVYFANQINQTGWGFFEVEILNDTLADYDQAYWAGYLEGRATKELIHMYLVNTVDGYCDNRTDYCNRLGDFLLRNLLWMQEEIAKNPTDIYWRQVNFTMSQLYGLIDGYEDTNNRDAITLQALTVHPIFMAQLAGDLEDLELKFASPSLSQNRRIGVGHCSALVKLTPNNADLLFSHVTWSGYNSMLRLQKRYSFKLNPAEYPGRTVTFSGYPGTLASNDDFVLTSGGLAVLETTISNYNKKLLDAIKPETVLCWIRSQIAHRTTKSSLGWVNVFKKFNSGTYNNQWTIVDYKRFQPNFTMAQPGMAMVVEQLPYFPYIFNKSGTPAFVAKFGDWFTYDNSPRALIFARDHAKVTDLHSLQKLMRYNDYQHDPYARCNCTPPYSGENGISARSDLNPANGTYPFEALGFRTHGATDMKATNRQLMRQLQFQAISGPAYDPLPIFDWRSAPFANTVSHMGQPDRFEFAPIVHQWRETTLIY